MIPGEEARGLETGRRWFNTAVSVHTVIPFILLLIGYPLGTWAIENWLNIPPESVQDCVFIFRFVCAATLVGMCNVPFKALYHAHQNIAELTIYRVFCSLIKVALLYWMVNHKGNWFRSFIAWTYSFIILEYLAICLHAIFLFPECKIMRKYLWHWESIKELTKFISWQLFGNIGKIVRTQGMTLLVNKMFGAEMNATMGIANAVALHSGKLEGGLSTALTPAINNLAGKGDHKGMLAMTYRFCRIGLCLTMVLVIPVFLERHELLTLWP